MLFILIFLGVVLRLLIIFENREIIRYPDSELYLSITKQFWQGNYHLNFVRLPGYSFFLNIIFLLFGFGKLKIVYLTQHFMTLLSCFLIYKILAEKIKNKIFLYLLGLVIFTNYSIAQWGQILLPEALLIFLTSGWVYLLFKFMQTKKTSFLLFSFSLMIILGFTKPLYLSFAAIYLVMIFFTRLSSRKIIAGQFIILFVLAGTYLTINKIQNNFFGFSTSDATVIFGKIVNFKMENCSTEKNSLFDKRLHDYLKKGGERSWYSFVYTYAKQSWGENLPTFNETYRFNKNIMYHCPVEFLTKSLMPGWWALFSFEDHLKTHNFLLKLISYLSLIRYLLVVYFILSFTKWVKRKFFLILGIFIIYNVISIYYFAADSYYRLQAPFELLFYLYLILFFEKKTSPTANKIAAS